MDWFPFSGQMVAFRVFVLSWFVLTFVVIMLVLCSDALKTKGKHESNCYNQTQ